MTPQTPTTVVVNEAGTAAVRYLLTNQAVTSKTWSLEAVAGITQASGGASACSDPFTLASQKSCVLELLLTGANLPEHLTGGPVVCVVTDPLTCYQPAEANQLDVSVAIFLDGFE